MTVLSHDWGIAMGTHQEVINGARRVLSLRSIIALALVLVAVPAKYPEQVGAHTDHQGNSGWFQKCQQSAAGRFDPILNDDNVEHGHLFSGGTAVKDFKEKTTRKNLINAPSTCAFNDGEQHGNHSAYWIPRVVDRRGFKAGAVQTNAYYRVGGLTNSAHEIAPFPQGMKIIARASRGDSQVRWFCGSRDEGVSKAGMDDEPKDCNRRGKYPYVAAQIRFPQCGDGRTKSSDFMEHMRYARADGTCPASHPNAHPLLRLTVKYNTWRGRDLVLTGGLALSDFHADYMEAWIQKDFNHLIDNCIKTDRNCFRNFPE